MSGGVEHWERVYTSRSSSEVSWYQPEPSLSLAWIESVVAPPDGRVLDVGAGASVLVDRLLERGYRRVAVLDVAPAALREVRDRLGPLGERVEWFVGDLLEFDPPHPYDLWHDRAVLHFLRDPQHQRRYAEVLGRALAPGGHALISTFAPGGPARCSGLEVVQHDSDSLGRLLGAEFRCIRSTTETHRTPSGGEQLFQYSLFRRAQHGEPGGGAE